MTASLHGVRVACFYPWNPFEPTGAWTRFCCLWRFLLGEGAEVTLAFFDRGQNVQLRGFSTRYLGDPNVLNNIGAHARNVLAGTGAQSELKQYSPTELTFLLMFEKDLYLSNAKVGPWLDEIFRTHEIVTCEYPMYAPLLADYGKKWNRPLVVTCLDLLYELHGSHPGAKARLKASEVAALGLANARVFCNDAERKIIAEPGLDGVTVLNTGDVLGVTPGHEQPSRDAVRAALKIRTPHYCLFVGSKHPPNVDAAEEVRRIAKRTPEVTFVVAGNCCTGAVEGNFIAVGPVSDQLIDLLHRGALAIVVPLTRGTGISVKTFQAFTYGKAVVSTPVGARGYSVADGRELLLVATSAEFPAAIRRLATDGELRGRLGRAARDYALTLDFRSHFRPYGEIVRRLLHRPAATRPKDGRSLILVDNNLTDRIGHHFNYALSLKAPCAAEGVSFCALVKQTAADDVRAELAAHGVFSQGIHEESPLNPYPPEWGGIRSTYDLLRSNDCFAKELEAGLERRARPGDTVFLPNATPRQMLGLALMLVNGPAYRTLQFVLILRYSTWGAAGPITDRKAVLDKAASDQYQAAFERLLGADQAGSIRLATDSTELAKEFGTLAKRAVEVLPIPHTLHAAAAVPPAEIPAKRAGRPRIVYLGDARDEKGFELLPAVTRAVPSADFVFQAFVSSPYHQRMAQVIAALERQKAPNVHLIKTSLSADAYHALLGSADLVLLPYDAATYRARTSGPFVEAICANKPVVVPGKSWMSGQLAETRAGVTFVSGSAPDLARALLAAVGNLAQHTAAAGELGRQFRAYHNPQTFVAQLMRTAQAGR